MLRSFFAQLREVAKPMDVVVLRFEKGVPIRKVVVGAVVVAVLIKLITFTMAVYLIIDVFDLFIFFQI